MRTLRPANERGVTEIGWLHSRHTFSFGEYDDPRHMGFRSLRVINDDVVEPGAGFGMHGHRDMEIVTVVLEGALEHKDSLGNGEALRPGEVQAMTAGSGIRHSEFNPSKTDRVHLLQVWIMPEAGRLPPAYAQKPFPVEERRNRLRRVAGRDETQRDGALRINQDAELFLAELAPGARVEHTLRPGRAAWLHVATGSVEVDGTRLAAGDAIAIEDEPRLVITTIDSPASVLLFDLA